MTPFLFNILEYFFEWPKPGTSGLLLFYSLYHIICYELLLCLMISCKNQTKPKPHHLFDLVSGLWCVGSIFPVLLTRSNMNMEYRLKKNIPLVKFILKRIKKTILNGTFFLTILTAFCIIFIFLGKWPTSTGVIVFSSWNIFFYNNDNKSLRLIFFLQNVQDECVRLYNYCTHAVCFFAVHTIR